MTAQLPPADPAPNGEPAQTDTPDPRWTTSKTTAMWSLLIGGSGAGVDLKTLVFYGVNFLVALGTVLSLTGLVLGVLAFYRAHNEPRRLAISGMILGGAGLAFGLIWMALVGVAIN